MINKLDIESLRNIDTGGVLSKVLILIAILGAIVLIHSIFFRVLNSRRGRDKWLMIQIREKFKSPTLVFFLASAFNVIIISFDLENSLVNKLTQFITVVIIFTVAWLFIRFISLGKDVVLKRYNIEDKDNLKARKIYTQFKILERILIFVIVIIALAMALITFESIRNIGISIFASAGVAGIILGFSAQKMIGTVLAGFQIALTQPIRLDDVVIVEGEWGWIEEITLTYVVIRIWDKRRLVVPSTYFIEKPFQNWTRNSSDILGTVFIYTDYTVPVSELRKELTRILNSDENWDGKIDNMQVTNATEKTIEIRALMSAVDSPTAWDLRVNVREKLIEFLQKNYPEGLPKSRVTFDDISKVRED